MKKELMAVVNSSEGYFRLNNIASLKRWTKNAIGEDVDRLTIEFDNINNVNFIAPEHEIVSRDYEGIITECNEKTQLFLDAVAQRLCSELSNGYRNKTRR